MNIKFRLTNTFDHLPLLLLEGGEDKLGEGPHADIYSETQYVHRIKAFQDGVKKIKLSSPLANRLVRSFTHRFTISY